MLFLISSPVFVSEASVLSCLETKGEVKIDVKLEMQLKYASLH